MRLSTGTFIFLTAILNFLFLFVEAYLTYHLLDDSIYFPHNTDVSITLVIKNNGNKEEKFLRWLIPQESGSFILEDNIFSISPNVSYLGIAAKRLGPSLNDYIRLEPGQTITRRVKLNDFYDFNVSGKYTIDLATGGYIGAQTSSALHISIDNPTLYKKDKVYRKVEKFNECNKKRISKIKKARQNALKSMRLEPPRNDDKLKRWFGRSNDNTEMKSYTRKVKANMKEIENNMFKTNFDCTCKSGFFAYVYPGDVDMVIYLCSAMWKAAPKGIDSHAGVLVHEVSHFDSVAGTNDYVYGWDSAQSLANENPKKAQRNADNYEYFVEDFWV